CLKRDHWTTDGECKPKRIRAGHWSVNRTGSTTNADQSDRLLLSGSDRRWRESELTLVLRPMGIVLNARVVRGHTDVTALGTRVAECLRVRAQRATARGREARNAAQRAAEIHTSRHDSVGFNAVFDPVDHRCEDVETVCRRVAAAVAHVGNQIELHEVSGLIKYVIRVAAALAGRFVMGRRVSMGLALSYLVEVFSGVRPRRPRVAEPMVED